MKQTDIQLSNSTEYSLSFDPIDFAFRVCQQVKLDGQELHLNFVTPDEILAINQEHLTHDYVTDIITFNLETPGEPVIGDLYMCLKQAEDNAVDYKVSFESEVQLLIIHGILHLIGYTDANIEDRKEMEKRQTELLGTLNHEFS